MGALGAVGLIYKTIFYFVIMRLAVLFSGGKDCCLALRKVLSPRDDSGEPGELKFNIALNVTGGGIACQVEAGRLAIAKAIVKFTENEDVKNAFLAYDRNMLIADTRRKEAYKPGDSKARAMRQTSFR